MRDCGSLTSQMVVVSFHVEGLGAKYAKYHLSVEVPSTVKFYLSMICSLGSCV